MNTQPKTYAFFILSNGITVKVEHNGDLIETTNKCKEIYGEEGYLDSVQTVHKREK